jgi:hypothetical protein
MMSRKNVKKDDIYFAAGVAARIRLLRRSQLVAGFCSSIGDSWLAFTANNLAERVLANRGVLVAPRILFRLGFVSAVRPA